jgi:type IV secretion system protein TrbL
MTAAVVRLLALALLAAALQAGTISDAIDRFHVAAQAERAVVVGYAKGLFVALAILGGSWDVISTILDHGDSVRVVFTIVRRIVYALTFWMLLIFGPEWGTQIIQSLQNIGAQASGVAELSPEGIFGLGLKTAMKLWGGAGKFGFLSGEWTIGVVMFLAGGAIFISFVLIAIQFTILLVLTYISLSLGSIFLGFGGAKWTVAYTERYFSLVISIGIKFLTMLFIAGIGLTFGDVLVEAAAAAAADPNPDRIALEIMTVSGLFGLCAWQIPKIFATQMTGTPAFGAGEFFSAVGAMVAGVMAATSIAGAGMSAVGAAGSSVAGMVGGAAGASGGAGGAASSGITSSGSGSVPPPSGGGSGSGGGGGSNGSGGGGVAEWTGPGSDTWAQAQAQASGNGASGGGGATEAGGGASGGSGGDSGSGGGQQAAAASGGSARSASSSPAWGRVGQQMQRAGYATQNALRHLSNDGGHGGVGPSIHMG